MKKNYNNSNLKDASRIIRDGGGVTSDRHQTGWVRFAHTAPYRKCGFTLAEVLITLGIIGVVAALTLPNLIAQHKKQTYVTQLRKTVSTIEQGFQKMRADAGGVDSLDDTEAFMKMRSNGSDGCYLYSLGIDAVCDNFFKNDLEKYFKIVDYPISPSDYVYYFRNSDVDGAADPMFNEPRMIFADGSVVSFGFPNPSPNYFGGDSNIVGSVDIDVNGFKAPNTYGYDIFPLYITSTGQIKDIYYSADECINNQYSSCYNYLARNGWKMDY